MRKIIYRKDGLNKQSTVPNGYKYVGYDGLIFSEKDGDIISPIGGGISSDIIVVDTYSNIKSLKDNSELIPGFLYHIEDRDIWILSIDVNEFSLHGQRRFKVIKDDYYTPFAIGEEILYSGVYGEFTERGSYPNSGSVEIYTIYGGRMWKRDTTGSDDPGLEDDVIRGGWTLASLTENFYVDKIFNIKYNFDKDFISEQSDDRGNIIRSNEFSNNIDITDWGDSTIYNNECYGIFNNIVGEISSNRLSSGIYLQSTDLVYGVISNNIGVEKILDNTCHSISDNEGGFILSNSNKGSIKSNSTGEMIGGNSNHGDISNNSSSGEITNNYNGGEISHNSNMGDITYNSNIGDITYNSNDGNISGNSNNGDIGNNENLGNISANSNSDEITNNYNNGEISGNKNNGRINGNYSSDPNFYFNIYNNFNNGSINDNSSNNQDTHIYKNVNNGNISDITMSSDITDAGVDK